MSHPHLMSNNVVNRILERYLNRRGLKEDNVVGRTLQMMFLLEIEEVQTDRKGTYTLDDIPNIADSALRKEIYRNVYRMYNKTFGR